MKRLVPFLALMILAVPAFAQQETLFGGEFSSGGFGGPVVKFTPIRGELGILVGGYGGWLINHQFMIGGGGYGLVNNVRASTEAEALYARPNRPLYVEFGYGGLMLEYIVEPSKLVHFNVQCLVGAGGVRYREDWYDDLFDDNPDYFHSRTNDAVFVAEPAVNVEVNMTTWMRVTAGASYRYVNGVGELGGLSNKDLSNFSGSLALKFGLF